MCEACTGSPRIGRRAAVRILGAAAASAALWPRRALAVADEVEVAPGLRVRRRSAWDGGRGATGPIGPEEVRFLLVHHSAGSNDDSPEEVPAVLRSIYDFHTGSQKGWPDVCYHFFVDRFGTVWEGRTGSIDGPVLADATGGNQGFAQLVCLLGDFTSVLPTDAAQTSLARTLAWLGHRYGVDTRPGATTEIVSRGSNRWPAGDSVIAATISGHRDMSATACPGDTFYPLLVGEFSDRVTAARAAMFPAPPATTSVTAPGTTSTTAAPATTSTTATTATTTTSTTTGPSTSSTAPPPTLRAVQPVERPASGGPGTATIAAGVVAGAAAVTTAGVALARRRARPAEDDPRG